MQTQKQIEVAETTKASEQENLLEQFQAIKTKPKKILHLFYESCCGCGCSQNEISRMVDEDDDEFENGDVVSTRKGDMDGWLDEEWNAEEADW